MEKKIDVLAVMDSAINRSGHVVACDVVEARAAVAELIAAGDDVLALDMETDGATCEWAEAVRAAKRLRAAMTSVRSS